MNRLYWLSLIILISFASCVPNRKVVYLQKDEVNKRDMPKDTVLRRYDLVSFDYKIQPHDILMIRFKSLTSNEYDFFSQESNQGLGLGGSNTQLLGDLVDENGDVNFPVVGKVKVAGLTVFEIQEKLQTLANDYLDAPTVKVRLLNYHITVLGEVDNEGIISLSNNRVSLMEAIGQAGLGELADRSNIKLVRQWGDRTEVAYVDVLQEDFMNSPFYYVHQNDIIVVPPLRQRPFRKYFSQNLGVVVSSLTLLFLIFNAVQ